MDYSGGLMTRRVAAHRGSTGHRYDGPQKTVVHTRAERERPNPPSFPGVTDRAVVTSPLLLRSLPHLVAIG